MPQHARLDVVIGQRRQLKIAMRDRRMAGRLALLRLGIDEHSGGVRDGPMQPPMTGSAQRQHNDEDK